jgi:hypothetical protein
MSGTKISLNGSIVKYDDEYWLVEQASDPDMVWRAIIDARVSGSVGASETEGYSDKPPTRFATVHRILDLTYVLHGVYGAEVAPVEWHHRLSGKHYE